MIFSHMEWKKKSLSEKKIFHSCKTACIVYPELTYIFWDEIQQDMKEVNFFCYSAQNVESQNG